jgi:CoA binding domain
MTSSRSIPMHQKCRDGDASLVCRTSNLPSRQRTDDAPEVTETVVHDCAEAGIRRLWMYRGTGQGSVSAKAMAFCQERGIQVVPGECPFMFLPDTAGFHRFHGFIRKITGRYPRHARVSGVKASARQ